MGLFSSTIFEPLESLGGLLEKAIFHTDNYFKNGLSYDSHKPMSELNSYWIYKDVREFAMPYEKRSYVSDLKVLSTNGWVEWVTELADSYIAGDKKKPGIKLSLQFQPFGRKPMLYVNKEGLVSEHKTCCDQPNVRVTKRSKPLN